MQSVYEPVILERYFLTNKKQIANIQTYQKNSSYFLLQILLRYFGKRFPFPTKKFYLYIIVHRLQNDHAIART